MFITKYTYKFSQEYDPEGGCDPRLGMEQYLTVRLESLTIKNMIEQICQMLDVSEDDLILDACEENGRIDVQLYENKEGYKALEKDIERWKKENKRLWLCTYTFMIAETQELNIKDQMEKENNGKERRSNKKDD